LAHAKSDIHHVTSDEQIEQVVSLAFEIWTEHYTSIIGIEQVNYMLDKFQSNSVIKQQIDEGLHYFLLGNDKPMGYLALKLESQDLFVSKIYLLASFRNQGYGKLLMQFTENFGQENNCTQLKLTVNKYNLTTIKAYKKLGFTQKREVVFDIGNGYIMDDYEMVKPI
jgi:ribosomal protein S18 acetylase RimI-like enzyme